MTDAHQTWLHLRPFFAARLGDEKAAEIEARMKDSGAFLGAPQTFVAELQRLASVEGELTKEQLQAFLGAAPLFQAAEARRNAAYQGALQDPGAAALSQILHASALKLGASRVAIAAAELLSIESAAMTLPSGSRDFPDPTRSFEERASHVLRAVHSAIEGHYKSMLMLAHRMHAEASNSKRPTPLELGRLYGAVRDDLVALEPALDETALLARNSEAHRHTRYEPFEEAVLFVNKKREGAEEVLRLDKAEFGQWTHGFMAVRLPAMLNVVAHFAAGT